VETDEQYQENRGQDSNEEEGAPAHAGKKEEVANRGEHISRSITFLKQSGKHSSFDGWRCLHCQRCAHTPIASHYDAEECAYEHERRVVWRQAGKNFRHRENSNVDHQRQTPAVPIREHPEQESTDRPEGERHGYDEGDLRICFVEVSGDCGQAKSHQKKIESVEQPPGKPCDHCRRVTP
jgi:hypothetical protein